MPGVGDVIAGKFRLDSILGSGGMGIVFSATDLEGHGSVAIKVVRTDRLDRTDATARLLREARAIGVLTSEHVARVLDVGTLEDESPYLVMERLHGSTVQALVQERGAFTLAAASGLAIQVCHALGDAHAHGIVHRDIKPSNLFIVEGAGDPSVKVIDFGLVKNHRGFSDDVTSVDTKTGILLGSPPFMSPEQIHAASDVDERTDLWSLGVVLYYLVTARLPFNAHSLLDLMTLIAYEEPPPIDSVPEPFERVVRRCLAKRREDRFVSAAELASALRPFADPTAHAIADGVRVSQRAPEAAMVGADTGPAIRVLRKRRLVVPLAIALASAVLVAGVGFTRTSPAEPTEPAPPPVEATIAPLPSVPEPAPSLAAPSPERAIPKETVAEEPSRPRTTPKRKKSTRTHARPAAPREAPPLVPTTPD